jgi:hypothetical protein
MTGHALPDPFLKARPVTVIRFCDYCGEVIRGHADMVRLESCDPRRFHHLIGEYHDNCWESILDAIKLAEELGGSIEHIPVAKQQAITAKRRRHRFPEEPS